MLTSNCLLFHLCRLLRSKDCKVQLAVFYCTLYNTELALSLVLSLKRGLVCTVCTCTKVLGIYKYLHVLRMYMSHVQLFHVNDQEILLFALTILL